ncbi:MAG: Uma2 family endonuclease [Planctomycetota bacterium]|nr:Uma2 family endonuclease [Planctomycetota bacterium]
MHALSFEDRDDRPREDHIVVLRGATWADYQRVLEVRGDRSAPRITYLEGRLQIMSPSEDHEHLKSLISRLVEAYCLERDIELKTVGSWTLEDKAVDRGAEPDECYVFRDFASAKRPDLAIEVVWTSGGIDKLEVYRKLGVQEVWIWRKGSIVLHALRGDRYEGLARSELLPGLDLEQLTSFLDRPTTFDAIRDHRAALG